MKVSIEKKLNTKRLALQFILEAVQRADLSWHANFESSIGNAVLQSYVDYVTNINEQITHLKQDEIITKVTEEETKDIDSESIEDAY